jgi:hypothetical protein
VVECLCTKALSSNPNTTKKKKKKKDRVSLCSSDWSPAFASQVLGYRCVLPCTATTGIFIPVFLRPVEAKVWCNKFSCWRPIGEVPRLSGSPHLVPFCWAGGIML